MLTIPAFLFYTKNLLPIYLVIFTVFCIGRFFVPAKLAIIPDLVDTKDLLIANSLVNITGMIAAIVGFGISGILVEWLGAKSGFYLDSLSFLISGSLIFFITCRAAGNCAARPRDQYGIKAVSREIVDVIRKSVFQEIKEGTLYFLKNKDIRFAAGVIFILWSALGAVYAVSIAFVQKTLQSATKDLGLLAMLLGLGLFLGSLVYGRFGQRLSHYKTIFVSLILSGVMLMVFAFGISHFPHFFVAAGLAILLGLVISSDHDRL